MIPSPGPESPETNFHLIPEKIDSPLTVSNTKLFSQPPSIASESNFRFNPEKIDSPDSVMRLNVDQISSPGMSPDSNFKLHPEKVDGTSSDIKADSSFRPNLEDITSQGSPNSNFVLAPEKIDSPAVSKGS